MCGIAGIVSQRDRSAIRPMTRVLGHRGPDGEGYFEDSDVSLGHRRLSIIDLEGGRQPIANEDETIQLVCNGEIYNSPELRVELESKGHVFRTKTDVEVILHLYEEFGPDCVKHLRGMFAFAVWDSNERLLLLGRDHTGQKPLFFCHRNGELLFASEIKSILASGRVDREPDLDALWHYVSLRYLPDDYTLFRNIQKLNAANVLVWKDGKVKTSCYWRPEFTDKRQGREADFEAELDDLLEETTRMHTLSDVRVGAFLSGGIDSSTVASIMASQSSVPIPCFSVGVEDQGFDELPYARAVAREHGMEAHERIARPDLVRMIPSMVYHMEEPADPFAFGVYLVSALAHEHVKVVLSGDGGDENFGGYDRYAGHRMAETYSFLPEWMRRVVMQRMISCIPESYAYNSFAQKARWLNEMSFFDSGERYAHSLCFLRFTPEAKESLFTSSAKSGVADKNSYAKILQFFNGDNVSELVDRMLYTDLMTRMPDHLLAITDRMSMAHSLEVRPTLMDYKLVEYAASLRPSLKLRGTKLKYLLKKVAARHVPRELVYRKKQGFAFPIGRWMRNELSHFLRNLVNESRFVELGIFERSYVDALVEEHLAGRADHNYRLWLIINLEFWYRVFIEQWTQEDLVELGGKYRRAS